LPDAAGVVLLDFDGVLCDSTRECMVVGSLANELGARGASPEALDVDEVRRRLDSRPAGPAWEHFRRFRPYVRWPREYRLVFDAYDAARGAGRELTLADFVAWETEGGARAEAFERDFFACRHFLRERLYDDWVRLFDVYPGVVDDARALARRVDLRILTGRDAASVRAVLAGGGWELPPQWVFDAERFRNKVEGFQAVREDLGTQRRYALLDDNILHLQELLPLGVAAYWATWGYVTEEHRAVGATLADQVTRCDIGDWRELIAQGVEHGA
jgi:FMN phosphatase YigB (HAD superfamily)